MFDNKPSKKAVERIKKVIMNSRKFMTFNVIQKESGQQWSSIRAVVYLLRFDTKFEVVEVAGFKNPIIRYRNEN